MGILHVPWPSSLPRFLRQESHPRPRRTGPAHLSLTTGPRHCQLSGWNAAPSGWRPPLCSETPPTPPSHHLVYSPHAQKCPCLCLSFGIHFPKQSSATSALVTRKAQLLQDPGDTKALPEGLRWGERRAPGGPAGLKVGVRGERRGSPRPCWAQSLLWSQEPSVVGVTRVPRQG